MNGLGRSRGGAAAFWAAAIACFVAACAALGAGATQRGAEHWALTLDGAATVRIIAPDKAGSAEVAARVLQNTPGVKTARPMSRERAEALVGKQLDALPELRLVEVELKRGGPDVAALLDRALTKEGFQAEVYGPGPWAQSAAAAARRLAQLALAAAVIAGGGAALVVPLVARVRARGERETLLAFMESGASPGKALGALSNRAALEGCGAGLLGALAALALAYGMLAGAAPSVPLAERLYVLAPSDFGLLAGLALLSGALAGGGARVAGRRLWLEAEGRA